MLTIDYQLAGMKDGERILDIGCGEGRHSWVVCKEHDSLVCALDLSRESLKKAYGVFWHLEDQGETRGKWLLSEASILKLPFKDSTFDRIVCSEVLEHVPNDGQAITEIVRVLKDHGVLAVSVPSYLPESICWKLSHEYHNTPGGHIRIYKSKELRSKLIENNLKIYAMRRKHSLHSFYWISRCLFGSSKDNAFFPSLVHKFLVWDLKTRTRPVRMLDDLLNTFFAKSVVFYARKNQN